jgi:hypothetical protein
MTVNMLCIRDPDWENEYIFDGEVNTITIDLGGSWNGYKDFCRCLHEGEPEAESFEAHLLSEVADLEPANPVRERVEQFFKAARQDY